MAWWHSIGTCCRGCNSYSYVPVIIIITTSSWDASRIWSTLFMVLSTICAADIITLTLQMSTVKEISQGHPATNVRARIHIETYLKYLSLPPPQSNATAPVFLVLIHCLYRNPFSLYSLVPCRSAPWLWGV